MFSPIPYTCKACSATDPLGIQGHTARCKASRSIFDVTKRNQHVTKEVVTCNQCVTKDAEIERLRNQLAAEGKSPKRDRAEYMRSRRAKLKE
jgi:hypothetical protein